MFDFKIKKRSGKARAGVLYTPHGEVKTPAFVPVATRGALKGVSFEDCRDLGADIFMINTFHFYCREEYQTVEKMGGLHNFLNINLPLMTDSGGFQVFSLGAGQEENTGKILKKPAKSGYKRKNEVKIKENEVIFRSPFDGRKISITPKASIEAQESLGADFIFAFDECTSPLASYNYQKEALRRTHRWAEQSLYSFTNKEKQAMFGIIQGGKFADLREESAKFISSLPFFGVGIGGSFGESYGDSKKNMYAILDLLSEKLPSERPRHLLGIGEPEDIVESAFRGVDLFDCVIPTRFARHGTALTSGGRINIKSAIYKEDDGSLDINCSCDVCLNYKKSYLHHLARKKEIYGIMLLSRHNLFFVLNLMKEIRKAIEEGRVESFKKEFLKNYRS